MAAQMEFVAQHGSPERPERHLNAARPKSPLDNFLRSIAAQLPSPQGQFVRAARVQNEFAPETFLNRYEKRFENREKGSEKRSETRLKHF